MITSHPAPRTIGKPFLLLIGFFVGSLSFGCASSTNPAKQRVFATPTEAATALFGALSDKDSKALKAILGPGSEEIISSGDPIDDQRRAEVIVAAKNEKWSLADRGTDEREIIIGQEDWPCPIPIVRSGSVWRFDAEAGKKEVLARRIGRNELATIEICRKFVAAQKEYAASDRDGQPAGLFAQQFKSDEGKHNGLYWPIEPGEPASPLGALVSRAAVEGYSRPGQTPFHGYRFKMLMAQGPAAPGGARSYIQNGQMSGGCALLAYPADYGNSGIMTFMVNQDGVVLESDLGEGTTTAAASMTTYSPDAHWKPTN